MLNNLKCIKNYIGENAMHYSLIKVNNISWKEYIGLIIQVYKTNEYVSFLEMPVNPKVN